ncbi:hypothetical protein BDM02DRAFT_3191809 [Thelephora ganbajun]|uniref:Uncharacterized protein n=1 Tax=Thelephora ganbajun TaxID=370292 RepID=A0ACB6Z191_THEGA|nr:hypothetical protein BDM02DRAFT_3191809 [Thelephora ganbajun]
MTAITDNEELFLHTARSRGRVILITGQAAPLDQLDMQLGIRKERVRASLPLGPVRTSLGSRSQALSCKANVVIGDTFLPGAQDIVDTINRLSPGSGKVCWKRCGVTSWEDQVALFECAMTRFGGVDIVIAGARVGETQSFGTLEASETDGKLLRPHLKALSVNFTGAIYTTQLALHYLPKTRNQTEPLKFVFLGFLGMSNLGIATRPGFVWLTRTMSPESIVDCTSRSGDLRHGDTDLTFRKTANPMFFCATNPDPNANGSVRALLQNGTIQRMEEVQERGSFGRPTAYTDL